MEHNLAPRRLNDRSLATISGWRLLIVLVIVLGIWFRFVNLDRKIYWFDETYTSLRASGHTDREMVQQLYTGSVISVETVLQYQHLSANRGLSDTVRSLAIEDPQHPPLYYVLVRLWLHWFGDSTAIARSFSAVVSVLVLPGLYWLCLELFQSAIVARIAIALMAVSPFFLLYAQEARAYSLWTAAIVVLSAALLRAMRVQTKRSWAVYAIALTLGLYSFALTVLVAIGHGLYVILIDRLQFTRRVVAYGAATLTAFVAFSPWIFVIGRGLAQAQRTTAHLNESASLSSFIKAWAGRTGYVFLDLVPYSSSQFTILMLQYGLGLIVLGLIGYSLYRLVRRDRSIWLFVLTLIGSTWLPLLLLDLTIGGTRSTVNRYLIPCFLGVQLAVADLLAAKISQTSRRRIWQSVAVFLLLCGIASSLISSQAVIWWNKGANFYISELAQIINRADRPLVISDDRTAQKPLYNVTGDIVALSHRLDPKVRLQLVVEPTVPQVPAGFSDVFAFNPSATLRKGLEAQQYQFDLLYDTKTPIVLSVWKLKRS